MSFTSTIENRRSCYDLAATNPISDERLQQIVEHSIRYAPSAFNSQSSRVAILKGEEHRALWKIAMEALRSIVPADAFKTTEKKISSFAAAYGTLLFFEDQDTIHSFQKQYSTYADKFPGWSEQHAGIVQFIVWTALSDAGVGASLQHYNPLIDEQVRERWGLPQSWRLMAQMPFGEIVSKPKEKEFLPMEERLRVFGA